MKITLVVDRAGALLCRPADRAKVPEVGQAFTIADEDDAPTHASSVLAVALGPNRTPLVYGGPWPHNPDDPQLKRHGFRPCSPEERGKVEAALAQGDA